MACDTACNEALCWMLKVNWVGDVTRTDTPEFSMNTPNSVAFCEIQLLAQLNGGPAQLKSKLHDERLCV